MTSPTGCDGCQDELDLFAVSNRDTGHAQFLGPLCLAMFGATMLLGTSIEVADAAFKGLGYQPTAATKKARADAEVPEYDPNRVIAEVVADKPEPPTNESAGTQGDESADQLVDKSSREDDGLMTNVAAEELNETYGLNRDGTPRDDAPVPPY